MVQFETGACELIFYLFKKKCGLFKFPIIEIIGMIHFTHSWTFKTMFPTKQWKSV